MAQSPDHEASSVDWIFGIHAARALLEDSPAEARRLVLAEGRRSEDVAALTAMAKNAGVRVERAPRQALRRHALRAGFNGNHQGVAVQRSTFAPASEKELEARWPTFDNPLVVVLDGIEDAGNLGACLRTAAAAGADVVLLPRRGSAPPSSAAAKAASGALERLFIVETANVARRLTWLREQGTWISGGVSDAEQDALPYDRIDYRSATAIVVGNEHKGLRRLTRERCDHLARIPTDSAVASLNVSVALGVLLFEVRRQRAASASGFNDSPNP